LGLSIPYRPEGHIEDINIKETLEKVKSKVGMLKILGSYPAADEKLYT